VRTRRPFRVAGYLAVIVSCAFYIGVSGAQAIDTEETVIARMHDLLIGRTRVRNGWRATNSPRGTTGMFVMELSGGEWRESDLTVENSVIVTVIDEAASWGLFHITRETRELTLLRIDRGRTSSVIPDRSESLRLLQELNRQHPDRVLAGAVSAYAKGETSYTRTLWRGVLGDASIVVALAAAVVSLVKLRRECRWKRGLCTKCHYDLAGLTAEKCPECGAVVQQHAAAGVG
jgi:hypothetical protein